VTTVYDVDGLYGLLPAWVRMRDETEGGGVLYALLGVVAAQAGVLAADIDQLYDDQFIETCAPWVIPYIGDLIGYRPLLPTGPAATGATRADVADTIGDRRRKGTLSAIEQVAADVTGWPALAVEYFTRLSTTQYVRNHLRPQNAIVDVHGPMTAFDIGTAFDLAPRTADVRRISSGRGRYDIPNVGVFVWRLKAYRATDVPARRVGANQYTFDPFGGDVPLANPPQPVDEFTLLTRRNVPFPLLRYPLYAELEARRAQGVSYPLSYFAPPPFDVHDAGGSLIDPAAVEICDLSTWSAPSAAGIRVSVDPELGRLMFAAPVPDPAETIVLDATTTFSGDYGGGAYVPVVPPDETVVEAAMARTVVTGFAGADLSGAAHGVVEIADSGIHEGDMTLSPDAELLVIRADARQRPVLIGGLTINAVAGASVRIRGLGISGRITVNGAGPFTLRLEHCSLRAPLDWSQAIEGTLAIDHCLGAAIEAHPMVTVTADDSVLDAGSDGAPAVSAGGGGGESGRVSIRRCTVFGGLAAREIPLLENSIVTGLVTCARQQAGCVRYSYLPPSVAGVREQTPPRFRCQPDLAIDAAIAAALRENPALTATARADLMAPIVARVVPAFTSRVPGQPGYAQLADVTPDEIRVGAEDRDEMGVFFGLYGPRKEVNLRYRLSEYLPIGLESGVVHAS